MLNKDFRQTVAQAEEDQPGMAMFGDVLGWAGPGAAVETGLRVVSRFAQPVVNRLTPKGGSALERGTRVTGRAVGLAGSGATQSGVYQATVGESIAAGKEGRAPSLAGSAEGFATGATDPVAIFALPAALGVNRILTYIRSGGATATPANIAGQIDQLTGRLLDPRRAIGQTLDMDVAGADIRPQAMDRIIRELESAGLSVEDISRLMESVQQRLSSLPEAQASRLTFGQALAEATARDRPQALPTILSTLRERRLSGRKGDKSAGIISGVTQDLERTQIDYLSDSISRNIGDTTLPEVSQQIADAKKLIGAEYKRVLAAADSSRPEARGIAMIVQADDLRGTLSRDAKNRGFADVESYIAAYPDEAGHWLRSKLDEIARKQKGTREGTKAAMTVDQLDDLLDTNPGYAEARQRYGFESGLERAQDWAKNFTNIARDEGAVADLLVELNRMPEAQRNVAMSSLRNEIVKSVRGGPEDASLRLSKWMTRGALDALEQLGEGGQALADDLRFLNREQRWLFKVDPETLSPTAVRMLSAQTAQEAGNAPISNMMTGAGQPGSFAQDALISAAAGQPLPIMTVQRGIQRAADAIFRPRTETLQDVARLYMGRRGNVPTPAERPDFTPLFNRGAAPAVGLGTPSAPPAGGTPPPGGPPPQAPSGRTVGVAPATAPAAGQTVGVPPVRAQGLPAMSPEATNTLVGAGIGAAGPAETPEERARNIMVGAGLGYGGTRLGAMGRRTVGAEPTTPAGGYFNRQSMRLPGVGPTAREAELAETWRETRPIVHTARTAASSGEQAADIAVQSRAPGDIARAKDAKAALIREIETAQALRAGMDTPEDARLADALEALRENTSDPLLISSQIGAAKTSLERLLTDLGRPTMPSTMGRAPLRPPLRRTFSAEEEARLAPETPEPPSRTRYAEGETPPIKSMGFGASEPPKPVRDARAAGYEGTDTGEGAEWLSAIRKGLRMDTESRMARAREMGFDTETVLYHGTSEKFDAFEAGLRDPGVWMTTNITNASSYARGPDAQMHTLYIKPGKTLTIRAEWENGDIVFKSPDVDVDMSDWTNVDAAKYARRKGYDTLIFPDGNKTESDYTAVVFNPENIRSVDAAFDPEKAGSSTLLAAAPFAAVGGVGAGAAMGDTEQKRTVGRPRANQEKRTVGRPAQ
jgi:hypothetical protein